jgi:hypothetical protein
LDLSPDLPVEFPDLMADTDARELPSRRCSRSWGAKLLDQFLQTHRAEDPLREEVPRSDHPVGLRRIVRTAADHCVLA